MISIRCSRLPLALACPPSQDVDGVRVAGYGDDDGAANCGSAVHEILAAAIPAGGYRTDNDDAALNWGADVAEVRRLAAWAWSQWEMLAQHFPDPQTEVHMWHEIGDTWLDGHADVLSVHDGQVRVLDFKTGRVDTDCDDQLRGYAYLASKKYPLIGEVYAAVLRVRDQTVDGRVYTREFLEEWWARSRDRLVATDLFNPGNHCRHCPRQLECQSRKSLIRQSVEVLADGDVGSPESVSAVYDAVITLEHACKQARTSLRLLCAEVGGVLPIEGGRQLQLEQHQQRRLDPGISLPILAEYIPEDRLVGCLSVSKRKVEHELRNNANRKKKAAAVRELMDRLDMAGALLTTTTERLECRRTPTAIGVDV